MGQVMDKNFKVLIFLNIFILLSGCSLTSKPRIAVDTKHFGINEQNIFDLTLLESINAGSTPNISVSEFNKTLVDKFHIVLPKKYHERELIDFFLNLGSVCQVNQQGNLSCTYKQYWSTNIDAPSLWTGYKSTDVKKEVFITVNIYPNDITNNYTYKVDTKYLIGKCLKGLPSQVREVVNIPVNISTEQLLTNTHAIIKRLKAHDAFRNVHNLKLIDFNPIAGEMVIGSNTIKGIQFKIKRFGNNRKLEIKTVNYDKYCQDINGLNPSQLIANEIQQTLAGRGL